MSCRHPWGELERGTDGSECGERCQVFAKSKYFDILRFRHVGTDQEVGPYNQHGLKNETPAATVEAHLSEVGSPRKFSWCRSTDSWQRSMKLRKEFGG